MLRQTHPKVHPRLHYICPIIFIAALERRASRNKSSLLESSDFNNILLPAKSVSLVRARLDDENNSSFLRETNTWLIDKLFILFRAKLIESYIVTASKNFNWNYLWRGEKFASHRLIINFSPFSPLPHSFDWKLNRITLPPFFFYTLVIWKKRSNRFRRKGNHQWERKKKIDPKDNDEDKRWKCSCVAIKSIPTWKWMRKKNGWDRNFESREDVYK